MSQITAHRGAGGANRALSNLSNVDVNEILVPGLEYLYLKGDESTDGSIRFSVDEETGFTLIETRVSGLWQPSSFETGPSSLWVGKNVGLAGIGHHLATESSDGHLHFHAHSEFDTEVSGKDTQMINVYQFTERLEYQPDDSGSWTGTVFEFTTLAPEHTLVRMGYIKTSTVAATQPVRIRTWQGTDDTGLLIFDQWYTADMFSALTEVDVDYYGYLEFETGNYYFTRYGSDADFSMKMNAEVTWPWIAADLGLVREDSLLQTKPWVDGETWNAGDYYIIDRRIYVCNTTGVQTGAFESNASRWSVLHSGSSFPWEVIQDSAEITIPSNQQMPVFGRLSVDGDVHLDGTLVIRS